MHKLLASILILWLTGLACVLCCEPFEAAQQDESCSVIEHSCCKKNKDASEPRDFLARGEDTNISCCKSSTPNVLPAQITNYSFDKPEDPEVINLPRPIILRVVQRKAPQNNFRPLIADRGGTYLRNCVFRI